MTRIIAQRDYKCLFCDEDIPRGSWMEDFNGEGECFHPECFAEYGMENDYEENI